MFKIIGDLRLQTAEEFHLRKLENLSSILLLLLLLSYSASSTVLIYMINKYHTAVFPFFVSCVFFSTVYPGTVKYQYDISTVSVSNYHETFGNKG